MNRGLTRQDKEALVRRLLQMLFLIGLQGLALFVAAGTLAWVAAWIYIGLYTGLAVVGAVVLLPAHSAFWWNEVAERPVASVGTSG